VGEEEEGGAGRGVRSAPSRRIFYRLFKVDDSPHVPESTLAVLLGVSVEKRRHFLIAGLPLFFKVSGFGERTRGGEAKVNIDCLASTRT
jgi:hypothetical protein